jgi:hypothetical protein
MSSIKKRTHVYTFNCQCWLAEFVWRSEYYCARISSEVSYIHVLVGASRVLMKVLERNRIRVLILYFDGLWFFTHEKKSETVNM